MQEKQLSYSLAVLDLFNEHLLAQMHIASFRIIIIKFIAGSSCCLLIQGLDRRLCYSGKASFLKLEKDLQFVA